MNNNIELITKLQMLFEISNNIVEYNEIKKLCDRNNNTEPLEDVINSLKYIYRDRLCEIKIGDCIYYLLLNKDITNYELFTFELKKLMSYGLENIDRLLEEHKDKSEQEKENQEKNIELKIKEFIEKEVSDHVIPSLSHILTEIQKNMKKYIDQRFNNLE